jgi:HAD superfamily hydrolase (TIGR01662 family)
VNDGTATSRLSGGVDAVVFDVGETLVCEDRAWTSWARWLGVSPPLFFVALGATIARRADHTEVFGLVRPGLDLDRERRAKAAAGEVWAFGPDDLYPDAVGCLEQLRAAGYVVGLAGNQPASMEAMVEGLGLPVDFVGSSGRWGVRKPQPEFFERVAREAGVPASRVAYVGDRLDNDVLPARRAGMAAIFVRRGPWGLVHASWPEAGEADARVDGLGEVVALLGRRPPTADG